MTTYNTFQNKAYFGDTMIQHIFGLLRDPQGEWEKIAALPDKTINPSLIFFIALAALPAIGFFFGTTQTGWIIGDGDSVRITVASAIPLAVMFYLAVVSGLVFIGFMMHWMSKTYDANSGPVKAVVFMGYCFSPIFLGGIFAAYPIWWLDLLIGTAACGYAIRLVYLGIPSMLKVPEDRGFLYASAVFMVALVYVVVVLTATVILWEFVAAPVFTN